MFFWIVIIILDLLILIHGVYNIIASIYYRMQLRKKGKTFYRCPWWFEED